MQLHGGIGTSTMEAEGRPLTSSASTTLIDVLFGDADHHLAALARMGGLVAT